MAKKKKAKKKNRRRENRGARLVLGQRRYDLQISRGH